MQPKWTNADEPLQPAQGAIKDSELPAEDCTSKQIRNEASSTGSCLGHEDGHPHVEDGTAQNH
jgi:hypothetical protein